jgi:hypothetical protein
MWDTVVNLIGAHRIEKMRTYLPTLGRALFDDRQLTIVVKKVLRSANDFLAGSSRAIGFAHQDTLLNRLFSQDVFADTTCSPRIRAAPTASTVQQHAIMSSVNRGTQHAF